MEFKVAVCDEQLKLCEKVLKREAQKYWNLYCKTHNEKYALRSDYCMSMGNFFRKGWDDSFHDE